MRGPFTVSTRQRNFSTRTRHRCPVLLQVRNWRVCGTMTSSANVVRTTLAALLLGVSAFLKLFPRQHAPGLLQTEPVLGHAVAAIELLLVAGIVWPKSRRIAALGATILLLSGALYVALRPSLHLPPCGCFGGHVAPAPHWHILGIGITVLLLADLAHPEKRP